MTRSEADVPFASSAEIDAASARAAVSTNSVTRLLPDGAYQYFVATRKQPGLAEIHGQLSDVTFYERDTPSSVNESYPPENGGATQFKIPSSDNLVLVIYS